MWLIAVAAALFLIGAVLRPLVTRQADLRHKQVRFFAASPEFWRGLPLSWLAGTQALKEKRMLRKAQAAHASDAKQQGDLGSTNGARADFTVSVVAGAGAAGAAGAAAGAGAGSGAGSSRARAASISQARGAGPALDAGQQLAVPRPSHPSSEDPHALAAPGASAGAGAHGSHGKGRRPSHDLHGAHPHKPKVRVSAWVRFERRAVHAFMILGYTISVSPSTSAVILIFLTASC